MVWWHRFRCPPVWGETDCIEFLRAWLWWRHDVDVPRPPGLDVEWQSGTSEEQIAHWDEGLKAGDFVPVDPLTLVDVMLVDRSGLPSLSVRYHDGYLTRTQTGVSRARGSVLRTYRYEGPSCRQ